MMEACESGCSAGAQVNTIYLFEHTLIKFCLLQIEAFPNIIIENTFNTLLLEDI